MQRLLAIDTTSEFGSLALVENGGLVQEVPMHSSSGFGHVLYGEIEQLLSRHGWRLKELDCFASTSGPGSFTGIRVGLAAVKGLGEALGRPVAAVSNLQAMAWHGSRLLRATLVDARRGEIYGAVYSSSLELVLPETVSRLAAWMETLPGGELEVLCTDFGPFREGLAGLPMREVPRELAGAVGRIAAARLVAGEVQQPAVIDANYVRRSDAELFWREW